MSVGLLEGGEQPARFRPQVDSTQQVVVVSNINETLLLPGDPNRIGILIQNIGAFTIIAAFRKFDLATGGMDLIVGADPLVLNYATLGPIVGDPLFGLSTGVAGRLYILTASDRGVGRRG